MLPPTSTRTNTLCSYTTLFRSKVIAENLDQTQPIRVDVNARPARCLGGLAALDGGDEVGAALQHFKLHATLLRQQGAHASAPRGPASAATRRACSSSASKVSSGGM